MKIKKIEMYEKKGVFVLNFYMFSFLSLCCVLHLNVNRKYEPDTFRSRTSFTFLYSRKYNIYVMVQSEGIHKMYAHDLSTYGQ